MIPVSRCVHEMYMVIGFSFHDLKWVIGLIEVTREPSFNRPPVGKHEEMTREMHVFLS